MAQLQQLPIDAVKIDRRFTADEAMTALVRLIIETSSNMGVTITAEGVESSGQAEQLAALGGVWQQGYLHGRPEPAQAIRLPH